MEMTSTMLGSSSTTSTLVTGVVPLVLTHSLCESNLCVCWERQLVGRDAERLDQRGGVRAQLLAQVVDRLQHGLRRGRGELAVLLEPAAVLLDVPQRVQGAEAVQDVLDARVLARLDRARKGLEHDLLRVHAGDVDDVVLRVDEDAERVVA